MIKTKLFILWQNNVSETEILSFRYRSSGWIFCNLALTDATKGLHSGPNACLLLIQTMCFWVNESKICILCIEFVLSDFFARIIYLNFWNKTCTVTYFHLFCWNFTKLPLPIYSHVEKQDQHVFPHVLYLTNKVCDPLFFCLISRKHYICA